MTISLLFHIFFLRFLVVHPDLATVPESVEVNVISEKQLQQILNPQSAPLPKQIVSPSERDTDPERAKNYQAEKDSSTEREQVRRGDDPLAGKLGTPQKEPAAPKAPVKSQPKKPADTAIQKTRENTTPKATGAPREKSAPPESTLEGFRPEAATPKTIKQLTLSPTELAKDFAKPPSESESMPARRSSRSYRAFSRPSGSGAQFQGLNGINDYLPNLPDGDITLLNAKADQYAVFVRRVATQVFSLLRQSGWDMMSASDIMQIKKMSTVRAIMSPQGKLLSVTIEDSSGNSRYDEVLQAAAQKGTRDPHPPAGALASDGNIRFIFQSKSWVQGAVNARSGAPFERRWLLLSTGLE